MDLKNSSTLKTQLFIKYQIHRLNADRKRTNVNYVKRPLIRQIWIKISLKKKYQLPLNFFLMLNSLSYILFIPSPR
jgi:hypothetical protein